MTIPRAPRREAQGWEELERLREWYRARELALITSLVEGHDVTHDSEGVELDPTLGGAYWSSPTLEFPAPACGLGRGEGYTPTQRIALLQFSMFNWAVTEERQRYFARRSTENNLHTPAGRPPPPPIEGYILPVLATAQQVYDLVPQSAIHNNQLATRCARPDEAMVAAVANRARREAEAEAIAAALQNAASPNPPPPSTFSPSASAAPFSPRQPTAPIAMPPRPAPDNVHDTFDDNDYTSAPLKFGEPGSPVLTGSASTADHPAPGSERRQAYSPRHNVNVYAYDMRASLPSRLVDELDLTPDDFFSPDLTTPELSTPGLTTPGASTTTSTSSSYTGLGLFGSSVGSSYSHGSASTSMSSYAGGGAGMSGAGIRESADWVCVCGSHNYAARTQCIKLECRMVRGSGTPLAPRSALGDPGDWFCDFCGLCNWARRGFCLRCCPLDADNLEEAITKGVVHFADPIIDILGLGDRRARALKKKVSPTAHCACFGPHHGTRCPYVGVGVAAPLWDAYAAAQGHLGPRPEVPMTRTVATSGRSRA